MNRALKIASIRNELTNQVDHLALVSPGTLNPADLGTRGQTRLSNLGSGSEWQCGTSFLLQPFDTWPTTIYPKDNCDKIPTEELRKAATTLSMTSAPPFSVLQQARKDPEPPSEYCLGDREAGVDSEIIGQGTTSCTWQASQAVPSQSI